MGKPPIGGAFGGLLLLLEQGGSAAQLLAKKVLWLLIGDLANQWSLSTLPVDDARYKDQREIRLVIGTLVAIVLLSVAGVLVVGTGGIFIGLIRLPVVGFAAKIRKD